MSPGNRKTPYLSVEAPDCVATIDFMGEYAVSITARREKNAKGETVIWIKAVACDDRATILGEILEVIPESDT